MDSLADSLADATMEAPAARATITVLLPRALAARAGNRTRVTVAGSSVREVIDALEAANPGLRFELCHETGELRPFVNVFVNGEHVRYLRGLETPVPAGATLHILPSVAGG
jgi:molybdopterin synthase sulfur carrier subunit